MSTCELCGEPMPAGEEMFKYHGYSGPCPKPPLPGVSTIGPTEELDRLRQFKAYVHARLDAMGVPENPDGPHSKEGCRVGDRLDWVEARIKGN